MSAAIPRVLSEKVLIITTFYGHYFELDESPLASPDWVHQPKVNIADFTKIKGTIIKFKLVANCVRFVWSATKFLSITVSDKN